MPQERSPAEVQAEAGREETGWNAVRCQYSIGLFAAQAAAYSYS